jgi:hypothetical protein
MSLIINIIAIMVLIIKDVPGDHSMRNTPSAEAGTGGCRANDLGCGQLRSR